MIELDAKGLFCPEPLMMASDAIKKNPGERIVIEVDQGSAKENISRLARKKGLALNVEDLDDGVFRLTIG